jgi:hypothetical protein
MWKTALFAVAAAFPLLAQVPCAPASLMAPSIPNSMSGGADRRRQQAQTQIEQGYLDLARRQQALAEQAAQEPVYTHPDTTPGMQWTQLMGQIGNQISDALLQGTLAGQRQQEIDLERQRFDSEEEQARQSELLRDRVLDPNFRYRDARLGIADWRINQDVLDAFSAARKAHGDFNELQPIMRILAEDVRPDWSHVTMPEYIECLYAIAKTANFVEPERQKILDARNTGQ